ncbi:MAG TPA: N-acetylmuramoyl-L-alanine amidase [Alphaproteobacteria bacterium]|nr:N-acetylmuramoyl-L-alanine amidase [Alphaproteobacteria bacterium]
MSDTVIRASRKTVSAAGFAGLCLFTVGAANAAQLFDVHLSANDAQTEIVLGLTQQTQFQVDLEPGGAAGGRVTADFAGINLVPGAAVMRGIGLVRSYHAEPLPGGGVRLVLDLARPAVISSTRAFPASSGKPPRVVIDLAASDAPSVRTAAISPSRPAPTYPKPAPRPDDIAALLQKPEPAGPPPAPVAVKPKPTVVAPERKEEPQPEFEIVPAAAIVEPPVKPRAEKPSIAGIISPRRTIVIDAGHGGIDPGAESVAGYHEKEVTLATARLLRTALEQTGRYKVVLTRDSDVYLKLHERVARARAAHGDLFISLHADSVADSGLQSASARSTRGASIYTLSETASDAESDRYAQRENRADAIGGVNLGDQSDDVAGILVDLTVRETVNDGNRLANMMVQSLENGGIGILPTTPHRSAGFAVLKSPDIPSVLIEMGYLSDMADARALADPRHQAQIARAIVDGVDHYFSWLQVSRS